MKKKLLSMAVVCALWSTTYAQTEKGNRLIGGNFGFSISNDETSTLRSNEGNYNIAPYIGFFGAKIWCLPFLSAFQILASTM